MGPFEIRSRRETLENDADSVLYEIQARGLFPVSKPTSVISYTTVLDITDDEAKPCLCFIDDLQEETTPCYQFETNLGAFKPGYGLVDWAKTSAVFTFAIQPPRSGRRKLMAMVHLFDATMPASIVFGIPTEPDGGLWAGTTEFVHEFTDPGYEEKRDLRIDAREIAIQLGVCVAMADGELADSEGRTIKACVEKHLSVEPESEREAVKKRYNAAMQSAFDGVKGSDLSIDWLLDRLAEIDDSAASHEAIELCYDIMAADGVAAASELKVLRHIAAKLDLDIEQIEKLHDQAMVTLDAESDAHASIEVSLGIDPGWDNARIKKHLRDEFSKWNSRMSVLTDPTERANAQRMIDMIGEARKRYA